MPTLLDILPLAIAIAASPFPIIPAILLLFTARPRATGLAFLCGWLAGIAAVTAVFVLLSEIIQLADEPPAWASWTRLGIGVLLLVLAVRQWLARGDRKAPAWMQTLSQAGPGAAARLALLLSAANPKITVLAAAAGLSLGSSGASAGEILVAAIAFTLIASVTVAAPVVAFLVGGQRVLRPLGVLRDWLERNNAVIMTVVLAVIGVLLIWKGWAGL